jgi:divalent metal cation (Fe/Co/Zn/Cd) transporter
VSALLIRAVYAGRVARRLPKWIFVAISIVAIPAIALGYFVLLDAASVLSSARDHSGAYIMISVYLISIALYVFHVHFFIDNSKRLKKQ